MYARPIAPRSIGGVLDDAIRLYRASFSRSWLLVLMSGVLGSIFGLYSTRHLGAFVGQASTAAGAAALLPRVRAMEHSPTLWLMYLLLSLAWMVFHAALIHRQGAVANDRPESLGAALAFAFIRLPALVVGGIVFLIAISVGFVLLVVPGIWLWGQLQLWIIALCAEDLGPFAALGRSWKLIEHHWWRATTTVGVIFIVVLVLSLSEGVVVGVAAIGAHRDLVVMLLLNQLVALVVSVFTTPLVTGTMIAMYYDLRLRREGGDLAARVSSLQPV